MKMLQETAMLFRKEVTLEWRSKYALSGILLYVCSTVFIVYTAFVQVAPNVWNALFWIIMLFASVNAVVKSFQQESSQRQLYYYSLVDPIALLLAKMAYNAVLLWVIGLLSWFAFQVVAGNPVRDSAGFLLAILLGGLGFSITFTFISSLAAKADNSATLMAILSFPVIIPILMTLIKLSADALGLLQDTATDTDVLILLAIDLMLLALSLVLYPFAWRD